MKLRNVFIEATFCVLASVASTADAGVVIGASAFAPVPVVAVSAAPVSAFASPTVPLVPVYVVPTVIVPAVVGPTYYAPTSVVVRRANYWTLPARAAIIVR